MKGLTDPRNWHLPSLRGVSFVWGCWLCATLEEAPYEAHCTPARPAHHTTVQLCCPSMHRTEECSSQWLCATVEGAARHGAQEGT